MRSMAEPPARFATRTAYGARQLPRLAWYVGHGLAMSRLAQAAREEGQTKRPRARTNAPTPDRSRLFQDMAALFGRDLANVEAGIYPLPADHDGPLQTLLRRALLFFPGLPYVPPRRGNKRHNGGFCGEGGGK